MFYLVGLGLFDEKDISLKGLECLKNVDKIYGGDFEFYHNEVETVSLAISNDLRNQKLIGEHLNFVVHLELCIIYDRIFSRIPIGNG